MHRRKNIIQRRMKQFHYCISNLIGLFIQSYDAGRGILSNSLLQVLKNEQLIPRIILRKQRLFRKICYRNIAI